MVSLMGQCYGVVRNAVNDTSDDSNCNFESGAKNNYFMPKLQNNEVNEYLA